MTENDLQALSLQLQPIGEPFLESLFTVSGALYYRFLYQLVRHMRPARIVELGIEKAHSTAYLAMGSPTSRILAVDSSPQPEAREILKRYSNIEFREERSDSPFFLNTVPERSVDVCFFDTDHQYDLVTRETRLWLPKMRPGGILVYDDISLNDGMKQFWEELKLKKISLPYLHWSGFGCAIA